VLESYGDGAVTIVTQNGSVNLEKNEISKLTTVFFDDDK